MGCVLHNLKISKYYYRYNDLTLEVLFLIRKTYEKSLQEL